MHFLTIESKREGLTDTTKAFFTFIQCYRTKCAYSNTYLPSQCHFGPLFVTKTLKEPNYKFKQNRDDSNKSEVKELSLQVYFKIILDLYSELSPIFWYEQTIPDEISGFATFSIVICCDW